MRAIVKERFIDKHTKEVHDKGEKITLTEKRFKEILEIGEFVEKEEKESEK